MIIPFKCKILIIFFTDDEKLSKNNLFASRNFPVKEEYIVRKMVIVIVHEKKMHEKY